MSESKGERYAFIAGGDERGWYHDSDAHGCLSCSDVVTLLNEHEAWRQEREAREHITVNGEPAVPPGLMERMNRLEQRFESLDDSLCETDDAVAEMKKSVAMCSDRLACRFDAAQAETRMDSLQGQLLALERRLDDAEDHAQEVNALELRCLGKEIMALLKRMARLEKQVKDRVTYTIKHPPLKVSQAGPGEPWRVAEDNTSLIIVDFCNMTWRFADEPRNKDGEEVTA